MGAVGEGLGVRGLSYDCYDFERELSPCDSRRPTLHEALHLGHHTTWGDAPSSLTMRWSEWRLGNSPPFEDMEFLMRPCSGGVSIAAS